MSNKWQSYKIGGKDAEGRKIDVIMSHPDSYIIYEAEGTLQLEGNTTPVDEAPTINNLLMTIISVTPSYTIKRRLIFIQIAGALDQCLSGDKDGCETTLKNILTRLTSARIAKARLHYIWASILFCMLVWLIYALLKFMFEIDSSILTWYQRIGFGGTGALFSVLIGQRNIEIDLNHSSVVQWSGGFSRIVVGLLASMCLYSAIHGKIVLSFLENAGNDAILFFCFLSGFSETYVPNLLKKNETKKVRNLN